MIFVHAFYYNFVDDFFFSLLICQKQWRKKNETRG